MGMFNTTPFDAGKLLEEAAIGFILGGSTRFISNARGEADLMRMIAEGNGQELLNEIISFRTGVITAFVAKVKQYANRFDSEYRRVRTDSNELKRSKTTEDTNKHLADAIDGVSTELFLMRKMLMYVALTSASTGVGIDKSTKILKKMEKQKGRR